MSLDEHLNWDDLTEPPKTGMRTPRVEATPGPWLVDYDGCSLPIITAGQKVVAFVRTNEHDAAQIAASPWLLAECKVAKRALQCIFDSGIEWYDNGQGDHVSVEGLIGSMEAAIAKAES